MKKSYSKKIQKFPILKNIIIIYLFLMVLIIHYSIDVDNPI